MLLIRDGWGINPGGRAGAEKNGDATLLAKTPFHDELYRKYPWSHLRASGLEVGLPEGQMGNSEVGHLNLGAGRIVYQDLTRINRAIEAGELAGNDVLQKALKGAKGHRLHLLGLVSEGGVHSHYRHMLALARVARDAGVTDIMLHAFTDGRDASPTGGAAIMDECVNELGKLGAKVSTIIGRYFAMDRDRRWDRTKLAWDAVVRGKGEACREIPGDALRRHYSAGKTDEFMPPLIFDSPDEQRIRDDDTVFFFNFRADRARQLSQAFLFQDFDGFDRTVWPRVHYFTLTQYDATYPSPFIFVPEDLVHILGQVVSEAGRTQLRIAETEKYPHVTYFFNGGVEKAFAGEDRKIVPSPKVATYDLQPEMSAAQVTEEVLARLDRYDLIILNFANPDMVGHTGVVPAGVKAVETIDACVAKIIPALLKLKGKCLITADHGNCEVMRNPDGSPNTAHTTNLVHLVYAADDAGSFECHDGILADVAPTILHLMGLPQPREMTGKSLLAPKQSAS